MKTRNLVRTFKADWYDKIFQSWIRWDQNNLDNGGCYFEKLRRSVMLSDVNVLMKKWAAPGNQQWVCTKDKQSSHFKCILLIFQLWMETHGRFNSAIMVLLTCLGFKFEYLSTNFLDTPCFCLDVFKIACCKCVVRGKGLMFVWGKVPQQTWFSPLLVLDVNSSPFQ